MPAPQPRRCGTCAHHQPGADPCSGRCRHPKRQTGGLIVLVREQELACRTTWGEDLWETQPPDHATIFSWGPLQGEYDIPDNLPPGLIDMLLRLSGDAAY